MNPGKAQKWSLALVILIVLQSFCAAFFLGDVIFDILEHGSEALVDSHIGLELLANIGLIAGIVIEVRILIDLLRRQAHAERTLSTASGALHEVIEAYFTDWGLTASEADVASFTIKGYSIGEIAEMRGSAEGTIKTHLNAIYRKAGVTGRGQLVSLLIEDLLGGALVNRDGSRADRSTSRGRPVNAAAPAAK